MRAAIETPESFPAAAAPRRPAPVGPVRHAAGTSRLSDCKLVDLPKIQDPRGNLTFIEAGRHLPFKFNRVFYLYDVPGGSDRGGHALKTTHQFIIAMTGSFDVVLDGGNGRQRFQLNRSYYGLYIAPMVWRELENFSSGSVALVLASDHYNEDDYIREHGDFKEALRGA
ncbi:MAG: WxcM-like domain-containing protein [Rhizobacter sp.]|nr:WxcM-like domain-containing protein [Rhizobacter sp.]